MRVSTRRVLVAPAGDHVTGSSNVDCIEDGNVVQAKHKRRIRFAHRSFAVRMATCALAVVMGISYYRRTTLESSNDDILDELFECIAPNAAAAKVRENWRAQHASEESWIGNVSDVCTRDQKDSRVEHLVNMWNRNVVPAHASSGGALVRAGIVCLGLHPDSRRVEVCAHGIRDLEQVIHHARAYIFDLYEKTIETRGRYVCDMSARQRAIMFKTVAQQYEVQREILDRLRTPRRHCQRAQANEWTVDVVALNRTESRTHDATAIIRELRAMFEQTMAFMQDTLRGNVKDDRSVLEVWNDIARACSYHMCKIAAEADTIYDLTSAEVASFATIRAFRTYVRGFVSMQRRFGELLFDTHAFAPTAKFSEYAAHVVRAAEITYHDVELEALSRAMSTHAISMMSLFESLNRYGLTFVPVDSSCAIVVRAPRRVDVQKYLFNLSTVYFTVVVEN